MVSACCSSADTSSNNNFSNRQLPTNCQLTWLLQYRPRLLDKKKEQEKENRKERQKEKKRKEGRKERESSWACPFLATKAATKAVTKASSNKQQASKSLCSKPSFFFLTFLTIQQQPVSEWCHVVRRQAKQSLVWWGENGVHVLVKRALYALSMCLPIGVYMNLREALKKLNS